MSKKGVVYLKMVSADGYETKPEKIDLRLSGYGFDSEVEDIGISLLNSIRESEDMPDVPFLNGGKSFVKCSLPTCRFHSGRMWQMLN